MESLPLPSPNYRTLESASVENWMRPPRRCVSELPRKLRFRRDPNSIDRQVCIAPVLLRGLPFSPTTLQGSEGQADCLASLERIPGLPRWLHPDWTSSPVHVREVSEESSHSDPCLRLPEVPRPLSDNPSCLNKLFRDRDVSLHNR